MRPTFFSPRYNKVIERFESNNSAALLIELFQSDVMRKNNIITPLSFKKIFIVIFCFDNANFNQEVFLKQLDKIMAKCYQDVPRNFVLPRSW